VVYHLINAISVPYIEVMTWNDDLSVLRIHVPHNAMQSMKLRLVRPIAFLDGLHSALGPRFVSHSGISNQADSSTLGLVQIRVAKRVSTVCSDPWVQHETPQGL
jgi:hypothetical protein